MSGKDPLLHLAILKELADLLDFVLTFDNEKMHKPGKGRGDYQLEGEGRRWIGLDWMTSMLLFCDDLMLLQLSRMTLHSTGGISLGLVSNRM